MKKLIGCAICAILGTFSLVLSAAEPVKVTYREWLNVHNFAEIWGGTNYYGEYTGPYHAFDGVTGAAEGDRYVGGAWTNGNPTLVYGGVINNGESFSVSSYRLCRRNLSTDIELARRPTQWKLEGGPSGNGPWTLLDEQNLDESKWNDGVWVEFELSEPVSFPFYQLTFKATAGSATNNAAYVTLMEVEYRGEFSGTISPASMPKFRDWLIKNGVTPTVSGENYYENKYGPKNAFDGAVAATDGGRYLGLEGATLVFGGKIDGQEFPMNYYRICQGTYEAEETSKKRTPTGWILEGADTETGPWVQIDARSGVTEWRGKVDPWREFVLEKTVFYPFYRLRFTESGSTDNIRYGVLEVEYCFDPLAVPLEMDEKTTLRNWLISNNVSPTIGGTNDYTLGNVTYGVKNAFDGSYDNVEDKRYLGLPGATLVYGGTVASKEFVMTHYRLCQLTCGRGADDRAPTAWVLEGANSSEGPWTVIDERTNVTYWGGTSNPWLQFSLKEPVSYPFYQLSLKESKSGETAPFGLMEVEFCGAPRDALKARIERSIGQSIDVVAKIFCSLGETRTVTVTVKNGLETVATASRNVQGPDAVETFSFAGLTPGTVYSVEVKSEGEGVEARTVSLEAMTTLSYKMRAGDSNSNASFGDTATLTTHQDNWVNVADPTDILRCPTTLSDFDFVIDATEKKDPTSAAPNCWMLRTANSETQSSIKFPGRRLTIIGNRNADLTYQPGEGGGLGLKNYENSANKYVVTIRDLCLKNGSVWNEASIGVTANLQARIEIPSGYFGYFECARNFSTARYLSLYGSFVGEGTAVFCLYDVSAANIARGFYLQNDLSAFAGKFVFNKARNVYFNDGCVPPGDLATLTTDGITLDNRYHKLTETGRSGAYGPSRLIFENDMTWAATNRGITVTDGGGEANLWHFMIRNGKTVTLKNPLYGSGTLGLNGESTDYQTGTLKLCGAQGDWSGTFSMANGTLVLAGAKPLGEGALAVSGTGKVELDASALTDGACYLKAFDGATIDVTGVEASVDMEDVALLKTPVADGVTREQLVLPTLPDGVGLRSAVSDGVRTFTLGKKAGIVIIVR